MSPELRTQLFRWGTSIVSTLLMLFIARLYQQLDDQQHSINLLREKDIATTGEIAVIQARLAGMDGSTIVRLEGTNQRLSAIEERLGRVQRSLEQLQLMLFKQAPPP